MFSGYFEYDGSDDHRIDGSRNLPNNILAGFPTREEIVKKLDSKLVDETDATISSGRPLLFMPTCVDDASDKYNQYVLNMFGCVPSGDKIHVAIINHRPSFDLLVNDDPVTFHKRIEALLEGKTKISTIKDIMAKPLFGIHKEPKLFKRISFRNIWDRKAAIEKVKSTNLKSLLYSDDRSYYYRKIARENELPLSAWLEISNYKVLKFREQIKNNEIFDNIPGHNCTFVIAVELSDIKAYNGPKLTEEYIKKDRTLEIDWDTETYTPHRTGQIPTADGPNDKFIEICMTVHWKNLEEPLMNVCIISKDSIVNHSDDRFTIMCNNQEGIIKAFAHVMRALKPDIAGDYNGGDYDWPFLLGKAKNYGILPYVIKLISAVPIKYLDHSKTEKYIRRNFPVKITPESSYEVTYLNVPGLLPVDLCVLYGRLYPRNESSRKQSLNHYCKQVGLPGKIDVSIIKMWQTFEAKDSPERRNEMELYVKYCIIDSFRTHQLMLKRNIVDEHRDIASMAYVSLHDAFYYAGGVKVCNLLAAYASKSEFNILMQMTVYDDREKGKYPGAWVGNPKKGLYNKRPVTGLDAESLYPSVIRAYNLSPDKYIGPQHANDKKESVTNVTTIFNGKNVVGSFERHGNIKSNMGLFPRVLSDLFDKRKQMKAVLKPLKHQQELMEKEKLIEEEEYKKICADIESLLAEQKKLLGELRLDRKIQNIGNDLTIIKNTDEILTDSDIELKSPNNQDFSYDTGTKMLRLKEIREKLELRNHHKSSKKWHIDNYDKMLGDLCFDIDKLDSKQKAAKIYMNTFYGEAGNQRSPIYLLQLAAGVTQYGKHTIGFAREFVLREGFIIVYGDTDSLYLIAPDKYYIDVDREFAEGKIDKLEYWTKMVKITMTAIAEIRDKLNAAVGEENKTQMINFAYEEVLFPVAFVAKKKYWGIPHEKEVNFQPKKLFIRGIDVVKQGQTNYMKVIGNKIMSESMSVNNNKSLSDIVKSVIEWAVNEMKWDVDQFVKVKTYKPAKKNISVLKFVERMTKKHENEIIANNIATSKGEPTTEFIFTPPEAAEKFKCIIVNPHSLFDIKGNILRLKVGDMMEYLHVVKKLNLPVNVNYYLKNEVAGMCARFIAHQKEFTCAKELQYEAEGKLETATDSEIKEFDTKSQKAAKKYLEQFIDELISKKTESRSDARVNKKVYKNVIEDLEKKNLYLDYELYDNSSIDLTLQKICNYAAQEVGYLMKKINIDEMIRTSEYNIYRLLKIYNTEDPKSVCRMNLRSLNVRENSTMINISKLLIECAPKISEYQSLMSDVIIKNRELARKQIETSTNNEKTSTDAEKISTSAEKISTSVEKSSTDVESVYVKMSTIINDNSIKKIKEELDTLISILYTKEEYISIYSSLRKLKDKLEKRSVEIPDDLKKDMMKNDLQAIRNS